MKRIASFALALLLLFSLTKEALAASKTKSVSVWVNQNFSEVKLGSANGYTVHLTGVTFSSETGHMTVHLRLKGGKKHDSVKMTGVKVNGKAVKENNAKGIRFTDYLYSDDGLVGFGVSNAKLKALQFSLEIKPNTSRKTYAVGPIKITFKGDFSEPKKKVKLPIGKLVQGETVEFFNDSKVQIKLSSVNLQKDEIRGGHILALNAVIINNRKENLNFRIENLLINKKRFLGQVNYFGGTSADPQLFSISILDSFSEKDKLPRSLEKITSGSFDLVMGNAKGDLVRYRCTLNMSLPKETPVNLKIPSLKEQLDAPVTLAQQDGFQLTLTNLYSNTSGLWLELDVDNQTEQDLQVRLVKITANKQSLYAYLAEGSEIPSAENGHILCQCSTSGHSPAAKSLEDMHFYVQVLRQDGKSFLYLGPYNITFTD